MVGQIMTQLATRLADEEGQFGVVGLVILVLAAIGLIFLFSVCGDER